MSPRDESLVIRRNGTRPKCCLSATRFLSPATLFPEMDPAMKAITFSLAQASSTAKSQPKNSSTVSTMGRASKLPPPALFVIAGALWKTDRTVGPRRIDTRSCRRYFRPHRSATGSSARSIRGGGSRFRKFRTITTSARSAARKATFAGRSYCQENRFSLDEDDEEEEEPPAEPPAVPPPKGWSMEPCAAETSSTRRLIRAICFAKSPSSRRR
mmetsp:Transcript_26495/g.85703  ORF Transcript_26495/g.85703 Transcript_26495/m.85703 type:complete len:213 (-) Transcript_26495:672-1310(-)